ncbi:MAG: SDR family oxidoreductase [Anaerolineales bacterium]|nr:SDR family oxidoreductase [Anaerolineales bacterium]
MTRLLITGSSGLLGLNIALDSISKWDVIGVDRSTLNNTPFKLLKADLLDAGAVDSILDNAKPEWLINCAAMADIDVCEEQPDLALRSNAELPAQLAKTCADRGIRLVHISTDAVFDGEKDGFYTEDDAPNPINIYSKTKFEGERAVLQNNPNAIVARVNFYGWSLGGRRSLAEFFFNNLSSQKSMSGFTDVIFCPMFVGHTSRLLLAMLEKGLSGLYHVVGNQAMSKYQFGVQLARKFSLRESGISPKSILSSSLTARRSNNLSLSIHKLSTDLGQPVPEFSTGLDEFYTQFQQGYPQKMRSYQQVK